MLSFPKRLSYFLALDADLLNCVLRIFQGPVADEDPSEAGSQTPSYAASLWAMLVARIHEVLTLVCPQCGGELKIVAFLTEADPIQRILIYIGEPATPPRIAPARAPPDWLEADFDQTILDEAEPVPGFEFDQTMSWTIFRVHFSVAVPIA